MNTDTTTSSAESSPHPKLVEAARCIEQARQLRNEFEHAPAIPAEVMHQINQLLAKARQLREFVTADVQLVNHEAWLKEPAYKHELPGGERIARDFGHGSLLTDRDRRANQVKAFFDYVRRGRENMAHDYKAALVEDATGELLIPPEFAGTILRELPREAVLRPLATVRPTSSNRVDIGVVTINQAAWGKLETGNMPADGLGDPPAGRDTIAVHDLTALVKLGRDELEDSDENLAEIVRQALVLKIAEMEDDAFAAGKGDAAKQPAGIATDPGITQGVQAAAGQTVVAEELKSLMFKVPAQFRRNGLWLAHSSAEEKVALLKDATGRFLWQPSTAAGEPPTLFGRPWYTLDGLPAIDATADAGPGSDNSVVFGDVRNGYMIADRRRVTVQRLEERYADEGKIGLLFTHRVGGAVIRPKAFAFYKL